MPLSGLNRSSTRPRGGVAKVELTPAPEYAGGVPSPAGSSPWAFRKDRARYSEEWVGARPLSGMVKHTLEMEFAATAESRRAVDELAQVCAARGVVAVVTMASGETLVAGYSSRFGVEYPLRMAKREETSGRLPGDMPTIAVVLESTY